MVVSNLLHSCLVFRVNLVFMKFLTAKSLFELLANEKKCSAIRICGAEKKIL